MYHFFVSPESVSENQVRISGQDFNHIKNVLRLEKGEVVSVYDGEFHEYICELSEYEGHEALLLVKEEKKPETELTSKIYLFQGLPKNDKMEFIVQKAVELGVYGIVPVKMHRSVVKYDDKKASARVARWQSIAESAAKQSNRSIIPVVHDIIDYRTALNEAAGLDAVLVPYEHEEGIAHTRNVIGGLKPGMSIGVFIGPEGGFEDSEITQAEDNGFKTVTLGRRILRTETAGLCALSVLMFALEK